MGFMYLEGECANKNGEEAAKWFRLAGAQGLQGSLTTLALMYQQGNGVPQDAEEAKRLYKQAGFDDVG
jgi:TPR repeat protein